MARILVVDDEDDVRAALKRRLEREGYDVDVASSAAEAGDLLKSTKTPFDVVITDMSMEKTTSGLRVLEDAMTHDLFAEVLVLTAYGNVTNAVESMRRGAFDYLEKNVPGVDVYEMLVMKAAQALERRHNSLSTIRRMEEFAARQSR